ncbi:MAG: lactonase family protein [Pirellulaceae bacterium]
MTKQLLKLLAGLLFMANSANSQDDAQPLEVWLGTGGAPSRGIYYCELDSDTGKLSESKLAAEIEKPGFLAMHPNGTHLYTVGSLDGVGSVVAYKIDRSARPSTLEFVGSVPGGDGRGTHISVDATGQMLLTAQYGGGSIAAYRLNEDGSIANETCLIKHEGGSGVVEGRQDSPHAHWAGFAPDQKFAFVPDLGLDQVVIYKVKLEDATIEPHGFAATPPGSGPRHFKFHPDGKWGYVFNELAMTISVFDYDADAGKLSIKQTVSTLDDAAMKQEKFLSGAEIRIHPSGNLLYASNRGHDSITVFRIAADGQLAAIQNEAVRGAFPRNFNLDPSGRWALVAGQTSHTLSCFEVDAASGRLTYHQEIISTPSPICVVFGPESSSGTLPTK